MEYLKSELAYRVPLKSESAYRLLFIDLKCPMSRMVAYVFIVSELGKSLKIISRRLIHLKLIWSTMADFAFPHFELYSNKHFKWQNEPVGH